MNIIHINGQAQVLVPQQQTEHTSDGVKSDWYVVIPDDIDKYKEKENLMHDVFNELMNEIILRVYKISSNTKRKVMDILKKVENIEKDEDDDFIKNEEVMI